MLISLRIFILVGVLAPSCASLPLQPSISHPQLGQKISAMTVDTLGGYLRFPEEGVFTLVDFWATYCEPCERQLPALKALYRDYEARGLRIVGISEDRSPGKVLEHVRQNRLPWPNIVDGQQRVIFGTFSVNTLPRLFLIDPTGRVIQVQGGEADSVMKIRKSIAKYLGR